MRKKNSSDFAMSLQSFSESLQISSGTNGMLTSGAHGPIQMTGGARIDTTGPVTLNWTVTPNTPSPNILKIDITASRLMAGKLQTSAWVIYRQAPLQVVAAAGLMTVTIATPTPAPPPDPVWTWSVWSTCTDGGATTRSAICFVGTAVSIDDTCTSSAAGPKPADDHESCNPYDWSAGAWGPCPSGTQSRVISCIHAPDGASVAASFCSGPPPPSTEVCTPPSDQR